MTVKVILPALTLAIGTTQAIAQTAQPPATTAPIASTQTVETGGLLGLGTAGTVAAITGLLIVTGAVVNSNGGGNDDTSTTSTN